MHFPAKKEFVSLARKGNLIPVYREVFADLETPVSAFLKLSRGRDYAYLLESVEGEEKIARFSFLATDPRLIFKSKGRDIENHRAWLFRVAHNLAVSIGLGN